MLDRSALAHLDEHAARVVALAREQAERLRSPVVAPEHLLLALLDRRSGDAARVMSALSASRARDVIVVTPGLHSSPPHLPFTEGCEEAIRRAAREAQALGDRRIGTGHLLLGALADSAHPAVRALAGAGVGYAAARAAITGD